MGYQEREYQKKMSLAQSRNALITLIAVNLVVFVILAFLGATYSLRYQDPALASQYFNSNVVNLFTLPASWSKLASRPWTILTHMFVHTDLWHIIGNMLWLWTFGYIFQDLTGNRKIFPVYFYGGLAGGIAFILAYNFFPGLQVHLPYATALGASAGVMAIAAAVTTIAPGYRLFPMLFGGIPVWLITGLYLVIDLTSIPRSNPGGHIAHLAGALIGFLFIYFFRRGYDWSAWMNNFFDWINNLFNPDKTPRKKEIKQELFYRSKTKPYKKTANITEQRIDEILDKINQKGYESLTEEEKDLLRRASEY